MKQGQTQDSLDPEPRSSSPLLDYHKTRRWVEPMPLPMCVIVVGYPFILSVVCLTALAHDVVYRNRQDLYTERIWIDCWQHEPTWDLGLPHWGGLAVQWLSTKMEGEFDLWGLADNTQRTLFATGKTPEQFFKNVDLNLQEETLEPDWCGHVPHPMAVWVYQLILPCAWILICSSSVKARWLVGQNGQVGRVSQQFHDSLDRESAEHKKLAKRLNKNAARTRYFHILYLFLFQAAVLLLDTFLLQKTWRWIIGYQVVWLGYSAGIVVVRPMVMYAIYLSMTMVDRYILDLVESRKRQHKRTWLALADDCRDLELTISRLWLHVGLAIFTPCIPFFAWACIHLLTDPVLFNGALAAIVFLMFAVATLLLTLIPVARVSTMFNSRSAFRGEHSEKLGRMAIVPVAKKLVLEIPERNYSEERHYGTYLEYVQGNHFRISIGIPGLFMFGVDTAMVSEVFKDCMVKLPLLVSAFLALRNRA